VKVFTGGGIMDIESQQLRQLAIRPLLFLVFLRGGIQKMIQLKKHLERLLFLVHM